MFRLRRTTFRARTLLLLGALLAVVYICSDHKTIHLKEEVKKIGCRTKAVTRHNSTVQSWRKCEKNESAADSKGFRFLSGVIKNFLYYHHCRHFPMLLDVPDKCGGADDSAEVFLLLVIKSSPVNYERRELLRKTWAKERLHNGVWIRRIFISGTMENGLEKERLNKLLELEQREYSDILQWDFDESFFNLTLKQVLFLEWMERNCAQVHFMLNGDDDVFANTDNIVEYLQSLKDNNGSKHLFIGNLITNAKPNRSLGSKYFIPFQLYPSQKYPSYCGGGGFLLSVHTALVIYNMSQSIDLFPIDDVYMGMCLAKAGLAPDLHIGVRTLTFHIPSSKIDQYDPCYYKDMLLVHRFLPRDTYIMWQRVHEPGLKCVKS
ncbi:N-acetyllactosaminide beta-1,3-N-acetylglucosaminyltransferase 3 [Dicentrarchus labrax]|uniref:Hexosyltransferase n=1 Tax=Dicentrarchus labrax TaxID=13489 RepID=A0A8C4HSM6_DICLA|nr:N-acetyllactosaminide beta-1,3-N-acetylglucosaminyltransferase 3 [Dicentrarchus labrax]